MRGCCWQPANEWDILLVGIFVFHRATRGSSVTSAVKTHVGFCLKWSLEAGWMLDLHSCQMSIFRSSAMFKNILADLNVSSSILQTNTHLEWSSNKGIWQCFDQSCIMWRNLPPSWELFNIYINFTVHISGKSPVINSQYFIKEKCMHIS